MDLEKQAEQTGKIAGIAAFEIYLHGSSSIEMESKSKTFFGEN